jgi:integrase/recombinase XerD
MSRKLKVDWSRPQHDHPNALRRYKLYLCDLGFHVATIEMNVFRVGKYLEFAGTSKPDQSDFQRFREMLVDKRLARNTINNYSTAIKRYHEMINFPVSFVYQKPDDMIPYFFDQDDVTRIFDVCNNIKHMAMLQTLFYGCLRASELCNLDDEDINLDNLRLNVRGGKGGRDGIAYINEDCARSIRQYLKVRPALKIDNEQPLFYTDYGHRWDRINLHRMFTRYKKRAEVTKRGGLHVFGRHTPATIMVAKGCDIRIVKEVLRYKDIRTTLRYAHVNDKVTRDWYNRTLRLG